MENHQNGGDQSRGRRKGYGHLYSVHETLLSYTDEALEDVEGGQRSSEFLVYSPWLTCLLTPSIQADCLESQMRELLKIQEGMDLCLDQRDEELHQLCSQSQSDGAQLAVLSLQMQELISLVE